MQPNTRIAVNTVFIYCRLIIVTVLSLFSTRYILLALGETDFGIYNLIAGIVGLFSFIATTMAGTTQRYISYYMGTGDANILKEVFYNSCIMHAVIALVVALVVEIGGVWCINNVLSIPGGKIGDALFVLHCVTCGLVATIICVPYDAILMAYENIFFVSAVHTLKAVILFAGALVLLYLNANRLKIYAMMMAVVPYVYLVSEIIYCYFKYHGTHLKWHRIKDYSLMKSMGHFAGWVLIGVTCGTLRTQGTAVLLNMFFGVVVNAANGIAVQVNGALQSFSSSIAVSIRPQLTKSIGNRDLGRMRSLTYAACKYPFLLMSFFAVPLMIAMPYVLQLWLKDVPQYSVIFCRLMLLSTMVVLMSSGMSSAIEAHGTVKWLHLTVGVMHITALPISYILFKYYGFAPESIMWCIAAEEFINGFIRLALAKYYINISIKYYLKHVVLRSLAVLVCVSVCGCFLWEILPYNFYGFVGYLIVYLIMFLIFCWHFGLEQRERVLIKSIITDAFRKYRSRFGVNN